MNERVLSCPISRIAWRVLSLAVVVIVVFAGSSRPLAKEPLAGATIAAAPLEPLPESGVVKLGVRRSLLLRAKADVHRVAVVDPAVCDIVQTTPREISLVGRAAGQTQVTFWFDEPGMTPLTYVVEVKP